MDDRSRSNHVDIGQRSYRFIIIMIMVLFNAVLGFWHERQAAGALDALKGALAQEAHALRGGKWLTVLANTLVTGDIVRLRLGNVVPADVKLLVEEMTGGNIPAPFHPAASQVYKDLGLLK